MKVDVSLDLYRIFCTVVRTGNMSAAARELYTVNFPGIFTFILNSSSLAKKSYFMPLAEISFIFCAEKSAEACFAE